jgi:SAM-dependent methyltransferase
MADFLETFYHGRIPLEQLAVHSYRVAGCRRCHFIYQDPILDNGGMQALYQDWIDNEQSLRKKLLRMLPGRADRLRLLEYGMGWGYWSRMAQAYGLDVTGFELSDERREYARAMGLKVITELPPPGEHFDCLYANQVFEHLPDPLATLGQLCARLVSGGLVYIRVPDGRGIADRLRRRGWSPDLDAIHPLEHINCFTRKTLIDLATGAGLHPVQPPLRLSWGSLSSGIRREIADRYLTTHLFFRRDD